MKETKKGDFSQKAKYTFQQLWNDFQSGEIEMKNEFLQKIYVDYKISDVKDFFEKYELFFNQNKIKFLKFVSRIERRKLKKERLKETFK